MAHVEVRFDTRGSTREERASVMVDGHELTPHVLADGFAVEFPEFPYKPVVRIPLEASVLDIDLPDAVLEVLKVDPDLLAEVASLRATVARVEALADLYDSWDGSRPHPGESSPQQRADLRAALDGEGA